MNLTPPAVSDFPDFPNRNTADSDAFELAASAWSGAMPSWVTDLRSLGAWMAALAADQAASFPPGAIYVTYTFDGASAASGDPTAGKLRLNNLTQGSATALFADAVDNLGVSALGTLARMTSTSTPLGTVLIYKFGDPAKRMIADVTANTPSGGGTGYVTFALTNVQVSTANPFANGDALVMLIQPSGPAGSPGAQGAPGVSSQWTLDSTYTVTGSPSLITFTTPSGYSDLKFEWSGITFSTSTDLRVAASTDGSTFGTASGLVLGVAGASGIISVLGYRGDYSGASTALSGSNPTSPDSAGTGTSTNVMMRHTGGMAAIRFSLASGNFGTAGTVKMFRR